MKKNIIVRAVAVLLILGGIFFLKDGWIYLLWLLMGLAVMGVIRGGRTHLIKVTRWGKANPRKAQLVITVLQLAIALLGMIVGFNFSKLGYELSGTTALILGGVVVVCFLSVPFLPKRNLIAIPQEVNKQRLAFAGIALSSFVMMIVFGNRIQDHYPNSLIVNSLEVIDQTIFPHDNEMLYASSNSALFKVPDHERNYVEGYQQTDMIIYASFPVPDKKISGTTEKKLEKRELRAMKRLEKYRLALAAGLSAGSVLLIILLVLTTCAGICLMVGGALAIGGGEFLGLLAILGGGVITWASIKGIGNISRSNR